MLLVEPLDDIAHLAPLVGQLDANRATVNARTLVIEERHFDKLLEIVGNVRAEIVAARAKLAGGQLLVSNVIEQQSLHRVDIGAAAPIEFILDDVEQSAMQPFDECQRL